MRLSHLEGLSTQELSLLANSLDIELPREHDRTRIIGELLEGVPCLNIYQQNDAGTERGFCREPPHPQFGKSLLDMPPPPPASLPKQYGFTYMDVLIRDPFWIYVFWGICSADRKRYEKKGPFSGYVLRVSLNDCMMETGKDTVLIATIGVKDSSRYLSIPSETRNWEHCPEEGTCSYVVDLCAVFSGKEMTLVSSQPFNLPRTLPLPGRRDSLVLEKPMMKLSGILDMNVYRNVGDAPCA
jgi:hypothetical protein